MINMRNSVFLKIGALVVIVLCLVVGMGALNMEQALDATYDSTYAAFRLVISGASATYDSAQTNTPYNPITATHTTSGTAAAGIGVGVAFVQDTAATGSTNSETAMTIQAIATDVTGGSEDFDLVVSLMDAGSAAAERIRVDSDGLMTLVNSGTIDNTTNGTIKVNEPSSATNTAVNILTVAHATSGTAAAGMGTGISFQTEDDGGQQESLMQVQAVVTDATADSEDGDLVVKLQDAGADAAERFRVTSDGVVTLVNGATVDNDTNGTLELDEPIIYLNGGLKTKACTIADGDATPDVSDCTVLTTSANTGATEITDLDSPVVGAIYVIIGGSATNSSTITDGGNFALSTGFTATVDEVLVLYVQADNDYVELSRSTN